MFKCLQKTVILFCLRGKVSVKISRHSHFLTTASSDVGRQIILPFYRLCYKSYLVKIRMQSIRIRTWPKKTLFVQFTKNMTFWTHRPYGSAALRSDPQGQVGEYLKCEDALTFCNYYSYFAKITVTYCHYLGKLISTLMPDFVNNKERIVWNK